MLTHFCFFRLFYAEKTITAKTRKDVKKTRKDIKRILRKRYILFMSFCFCFVQFDGEKLVFLMISRLYINCCFIRFKLSTFVFIEMHRSSLNRTMLYIRLLMICVCAGVWAFVCVYMYGAVDDAVRVLLLFFSIKVSWSTENR